MGPGNTGEERILSVRYGPCDSDVHSGKELVVDDKQILCKGCYRFMMPCGSGALLREQLFLEIGRTVHVQGHGLLESKLLYQFNTLVPVSVLM